MSRSRTQPRAAQQARASVPTVCLLVLVRLLQRVADLQDACTAARQNVEREQDEHQAYRAAHKGSCPHPACRLTLPHGHTRRAA